MLQYARRCDRPTRYAQLMQLEPKPRVDQAQFPQASMFALGTIEGQNISTEISVDTSTSDFAGDRTAHIAFSSSRALI